MIDRITQPPLDGQSSISELFFETVTLDNGLVAYILNSPNAGGAVKLDLVFGAGAGCSAQKGIASAANSLFSEGTKDKPAQEIHEAFDFYGAYLERECSADDARTSLYSLQKFLPHTLNLLVDVFNNATFPQQELELYTSRHKQKLAVNSQKNSFLAKRLFAQKIWGLEHPYGRHMLAEDFDSLTQSAVSTFFFQKYSPENCYLIVSGSLGLNDISILNQSLGSKKWATAHATPPANSLSWKSSTEKGLFVEQKKESVQAALLMGGQTIGRNDPDYFGLQVLNTLLGGYFGSRLMKKIREEKGYTYGIGSSILVQKNGAVFCIQTEVAVDKWELVLQDIRAEVVTLQRNMVDSAELALVKNYMIGSLQRSFDGVFAKADRLKTLIDNNLDLDYFVKYSNSINKLQANDLQQLAIKYLDIDDFTEVVA